MFCFCNNDEPAEWVIEQVSWEWKEDIFVFGVPVETYGLSYMKWKNEVCGLIVTGGDNGGRCANRRIERHNRVGCFLGARDSGERRRWDP
jgi:hypothetical protein